jgi:hypothetical protein
MNYMQRGMFDSLTVQTAFNEKHCMCYRHENLSTGYGVEELGILKLQIPNEDGKLVN